MACTPLPPPEREAGESDAAYSARIEAIADAQRLADQRRVWDSAESVALVRVERIKPYKSGLYADQHGSFVSTERWLKGRGGSVDFEFKPIGACFGEDNVANGELGQAYIVYFAKGRPSPKKIIYAWPTRLIRDPRARQGL